MPTWGSDFLTTPGPFGLQVKQWILLPLAVAICLLVGRLLGRASSIVLKRAAAHTKTEWDDALVANLGGPLALGWALALMFAALPLLGLPPGAYSASQRLLRAILLGAVFWAAIRGVGVAATLSLTSRWAHDNPSVRSLVALGSRIANVVVFAVAAVAILSELGYPAASLIAGLGIGGLALALAAQKTVENVFGAFSIGFDQPFREGDFVKIEDFFGTVEAIGLRSTRIRTLDRTIITLPNGKLADTRVESFAVRDRLRLSTTLQLVYATTEPQLRRVLADVEVALRKHPKVWPDKVIVRLKELGASSIDVEVMAWFLTTDFDEFAVYRQELLLQFVRIVAEAGSDFAFPTRTVHVVGAK